MHTKWLLIGTIRAHPSNEDTNMTNDQISIQILGMDAGAPHEGEVGSGLTLHTDRGDIRAILHQADSADAAVLWVWGAHGGFAGPADSIYSRLSEEFTTQGITSLRVDYRNPRGFVECVLDTLGGLLFLGELGYRKIVLCGHSLGGAVVIAAAPFSPLVNGVVALSSQTYGAQSAANVSPRPLLLVHGEADTHLPVHCSRAIYGWAREPKKLVVFPEATHSLYQCRDALHDLLTDWILENLGG